MSHGITKVVRLIWAKELQERAAMSMDSKEIVRGLAKLITKEYIPEPYLGCVNDVATTLIEAGLVEVLEATKAVNSLIDEHWQLARGLSNRDWVLGMQKLRAALAKLEDSVK